MIRPNIAQDSFICLGIARGLAPYDTGNLRFNAVRSFMTNNGFTINYSVADAYYVFYLEESENRHKGFIGQKTVPAVANYLFNKYVTHYSYNSRKYKDFAENANIFGINDNTVSKFDYMSRELRHKSSLVFGSLESYRYENEKISQDIDPVEFRSREVLL